MRLLRWTLGIVVGLVLLITLLFVGARFADGPIAVIPGGPLRAGELVEKPVTDWSFAAREDEIELQLLTPARSRIVWVVVDEGIAYVPCSLNFPPFKRWHEEALRDGRGLVRIQGRRYPVRLVRVTEPARVERIGKLVGEKYELGLPRAEGGQAWFFRLDSAG